MTTAFTTTRILIIRHQRRQSNWWWCAVLVLLLVWTDTAAAAARGRVRTSVNNHHHDNHDNHDNNNDNNNRWLQKDDKHHHKNTESPTWAPTVEPTREKDRKDKNKNDEDEKEDNEKDQDKDKEDVITVTNRPTAPPSTTRPSSVPSWRPSAAPTGTSSATPTSLVAIQPDPKDNKETKTTTAVPTTAPTTRPTTRPTAVPTTRPTATQAWWIVAAGSRSSAPSLVPTVPPVLDIGSSSTDTIPLKTFDVQLVAEPVWSSALDGPLTRTLQDYVTQALTESLPRTVVQNTSLAIEMYAYDNDGSSSVAMFRFGGQVHYQNHVPDLYVDPDAIWDDQVTALADLIALQTALDQQPILRNRYVTVLELAFLDGSAGTSISPATDGGTNDQRRWLLFLLVFGGIAVVLFGLFVYLYLQLDDDDEESSSGCDKDVDKDDDDLEPTPPPSQTSSPPRVVPPPVDDREPPLMVDREQPQPQSPSAENPFATTATNHPPSPPRLTHLTRTRTTPLYPTDWQSTKIPREVTMSLREQPPTVDSGAVSGNGNHHHHHHHHHNHHTTTIPNTTTNTTNDDDDLKTEDAASAVTVDWIQDLVQSSSSSPQIPPLAPPSATAPTPHSNDHCVDAQLEQSERSSSMEVSYQYYHHDDDEETSSSRRDPAAQLPRQHTADDQVEAVQRGKQHGGHIRSSSPELNPRRMRFGMADDARSSPFPFVTTTTSMTANNSSSGTKKADPVASNESSPATTTSAEWLLMARRRQPQEPPTDNNDDDDADDDDDGDADDDDDDNNDDNHHDDDDKTDSIFRNAHRTVVSPLESVLSQLTNQQQPQQPQHSESPAPVYSQTAWPVPSPQVSGGPVVYPPPPSSSSSTGFYPANNPFLYGMPLLTQEQLLQQQLLLQQQQQQQQLLQMQQQQMLQQNQMPPPPKPIGVISAASTTSTTVDTSVAQPHTKVTPVLRGNLVLKVQPDTLDTLGRDEENAADPDDDYQRSQSNGKASWNVDESIMSEFR